MKKIEDFLNWIYFNNFILFHFNILLQLLLYAFVLYFYNQFIVLFLVPVFFILLVICVICEWRYTDFCNLLYFIAIIISWSVLLCLIYFCVITEPTYYINKTEDGKESFKIVDRYNPSKTKKEIKKITNVDGTISYKEIDVFVQEYKKIKSEDGTFTYQIIEE